jgi:hypothetical protein
MAILNPNTGRVVQGVAQGPCSVDGKIGVAQYGGWAKWLYDDTVIYTTGNAVDPTDHSQDRIESFNINTGARTILTNRGANILEAGAGRWCGWTDGTSGIFGSLTNAHAGLKNIGPDGTIAITPIYASGLGCRLYSPDGRVTEGPQEAMKALRVTGPTSAIWTLNGDIHALNGSVPVGQAGPAYRPKRVVIGQEEWIIYETTIGIVAHPYSSLMGYRIAAPGQAFWVDVIAWQGKLRVAYSSNAADTPQGLVVRDIDIRSKRTDLSKLGSGGYQAQSQSFVVTSSTTAVPASPASVIFAQNGLLEDEIAYRLALVATNILEPLKKQYPNIVVISGFRQTNTGIGQHERGEAVDIQIKNQTDALLYECASWIRDHLPFDQLILNFTAQGDKKPWIHVSFSPTSLRYDVQTKDYADNFHQGLGMVIDYTTQEAATMLIAQAQVDALIANTLTTQQARETRSATSVVYGDDVPQTVVLVSNASRPEYIEVISKITDIMLPYLGGLPEGEAAFQILLRVAWQLRGEGVGLIITPTNSRGMQIASEDEDFFVNYATANGQSGGYNFSGRWVGYSTGQMFQILGPLGTFLPQWTAAPTTGTTNPPSASRWKPAIDPGSQYTTAWQTVVLAPSSNSAVNF